MNSKLLLIIVAGLGWLTVNAQRSDSVVFQPEGKMVVQVINRTDYDLNTKSGGMYINRAHLGYQYQFAPQWLGKIVVDAGRPTVFGDLQAGDSLGESLPVNYEYKEGSYYTMTLKFSYLQWKPSKQLTLQAGGILQNHYITQEKFWGYRYVFETFQDRYYGTPSGDLGAIIYYSPYSWLAADLSLSNGEGFRVNQDERGKVKWAAGVDLKPTKSVLFRFYLDRKYLTTETGEETSQEVYSFFAGIRFNKKLRTGFEITRLNRFNGSAGHDLYGISAFVSWSPTMRTDCFIRYDVLGSSHTGGDIDGWNREKDGQLWLGGIHYSVTDGVSASLSYRYHVAAPGANTSDYNVISLSFEYKLN